MRSFPHIQQLSFEWEHSVVVPAHHTQPTDSQRLGRVPFGEDESTLLRVPATCLIGIIQLWNTLREVYIRGSIHMYIYSAHIYLHIHVHVHVHYNEYIIHMYHTYMYNVLCSWKLLQVITFMGIAAFCKDFSTNLSCSRAQTTFPIGNMQMFSL